MEDLGDPPPGVDDGADVGAVLDHDVQQGVAQQLSGFGHRDGAEPGELARLAWLQVPTADGSQIGDQDGPGLRPPGPGPLAPGGAGGQPVDQPDQGVVVEGVGAFPPALGSGLLEHASRVRR